MSTIGSVNSSSSVNSSLPEITFIDEFEEKYSIEVKGDLIEVVDRVNQQALATLKIPPDDPQYKSRSHDSHFHKGTYYFVLDSINYKCRDVYSFTLSNKSIRCRYSPVNNP